MKKSEQKELNNSFFFLLFGKFIMCKICVKCLEMSKYCAIINLNDSEGNKEILNYRLPLSLGGVIQGNTKKNATNKFKRKESYEKNKKNA